MNVPKLRFSEFSDEYSNLYLSDITTLIKDGTHGTHKNYEGGIPLLSAKDIYNNKINIPKDCRRISLEDYNKIYKNYSLIQNDILLTIVGSIGRTALYNNEKISFQRSVATIRINQQNSPKYIRQYIESSIINTQLNNMMNTSAQGGVYLSSLSKLNFNLPNLSEQKKIAHMLELLDKKINLQNKKIEALKLFKKGLFDTQLKTNGKESIMFDDFLDEVTEKSSIQNQYPVLSSTSKGLFLQSDYFNKQALSENNVGYKILKRNQLVLSPQNLWMGNININNIFDIGIVSPSYRVYNIDIKKIDLNYFNYWIKTPKALYNYLISSEQGASIVRRNLNIEMFNQISIKVPILEKQHIIGNKIYQFDLRINLEEEKLKLLHKLKKGLMQNMFV